MNGGRLQAFYINLDSRTDRREFMQAQLDRLGLRAERLAATSPKTLTIAAAATGHPEMAIREPMTLSELACLESHSTLWRKAAAADGLTLILEDDVVLSPRLCDFLTTLEPGAWDVLRLETNFHTVRLSGDESIINGASSRRLMQPQSGAGAYILTPKAARTYLASPHLWGVPADTMILSPPHVYELRVFQVLPALSTHLEQLPAEGGGQAAAISEIGKTRSEIIDRAARGSARWRATAAGALLGKGVGALQLLRWFSPSAVLKSRRMHVPFDQS